MSVIAIAMLTAWVFGIWTLILGSVIYFISQYYDYAVSSDFGNSNERINDSRKDAFLYAVWCAVMLILAAILGLLNGYDVLMEFPVGNDFTYKTIHQSGGWWFSLIALSLVRGIFVQKAIEKKVLNNKWLFNA